MRLRICAFLMAFGLITLPAAAVQQDPPQPPESKKQDGSTGTPSSAAGQDQAAPQPAAPADMVLDEAQPDYTIVNLPTTLRLPRGKSAFRVTHRFTHRFTRPFGQGDFGDLAGDLFGLDNAAFIGLEYRIGVAPGAQLVIHRTSGDKSIQLLGQFSAVVQNATRPFGLDAIVAIDGQDNLTEEHAGTFGLLLSAKTHGAAAFYLEPMVVLNSRPEFIRNTGDDYTVMVGVGTRLRISRTVYLVAEVTPRVAGFRPGKSLIAFGLEKRVGGHSFQLNIGDGFATTFRQIALGGTSYENWYLGFNIARKFF